MLVSPSLLSADFANLQKEIERLNESEADYLHLDIMDGVFVPNISYGMPIIETIKKHSKKPLDVHLMIVEPERYIERFIELGADILTIHQEASMHLNKHINRIKELGVKAGISINPSTPVDTLQDIIKDVDLVLLMSVNPGFGGQKFIKNSYNKLQELVELRGKTGSKAIIEIDGGVNAENYKRLYHLGADMLVAGNFIFASENPLETIKMMKQNIL